MSVNIKQKAEVFAEAHKQETIDLLTTISKIPAPSNYEEKRAEFCKNWLEKQGAKDVYIDSALNVVWPLGVTDSNDVVVFMAHTDVVFPNTEELPVYEKDGNLYGPGTGDNSSNLTNMLMSAKFLLENGLKPRGGMGILFVASSGEEGLGNLKGSRKIFEDYGTRIKEFIGIDGGIAGICTAGVGSRRYKVTLETEGGHSFGDFGNRNAIHHLAMMINTLYSVKTPQSVKTTHNVGMIEGGTSVNTIAQSASMLYEFRSADYDSLEFMQKFFDSVVSAYENMGVKITVETLGIRPCNKGVDEAAVMAIVDRCRAIVDEYYPVKGGISLHAGSTDANITLSNGIPSVTIGTTVAHGAHTLGEWVELDSMVPGQKICIANILHYIEG